MLKSQQSLAFNIYEQDKFRAHLSWALKIYDLKARTNLDIAKSVDKQIYKTLNRPPYTMTTLFESWNSQIKYIP